MPLAVRAQVVDIRSDAPHQDDAYLVDTNVWYWLIYSRASLAAKPPAPYQTQRYPSYLKAARKARANLHYCGLSFAELAHNIEENERKLFCVQACRDIKLKDFRHDYPDEHKRVTESVAAAWDQVVAVAQLLPLNLNQHTIEAASVMLPEVGLDGYDLFMVQAMRTNEVTQIITDDGDYLTVPDIILFTANSRVINVARDTGKLLTR